jgi:hypothetical protein
MYGPWNGNGTGPGATSDGPSRPAPNATPLSNTSPVWKRRRISEGNQGRRASKTTRACDACKVCTIDDPHLQSDYTAYTTS